jgi:primosomal protein N' (replication factor Y)
VSGIDRAFHYVAPAGVDGAGVVVGTIVRVRLHGRSVRGYVVAVGTPVPPGVRPQEILQVVSLGPSPDVVELCRWSAWRYAGRMRPFLKAASSPTLVRGLPAPPARPLAPAQAAFPDNPPPGPEPRSRAPGLESAPWLVRAAATALQARDAVLRIPPAVERLPVVLELLEATRENPGDALILVESQADAATLVRRLERHGIPACLYPEHWGEAAAGGRVVIGTRNVSLAPGDHSVIVVLDAHSESYRSERAPTFDARTVVAERARREQVPVVFVSSCPSVELLDGRGLVTIERSAERSGWPPTSVLDAREEDPREGGYPSRLVTLVRAEVAAGASPRRPVVLVLNQKGRARLLSCPACRTVQRCVRCGGAVIQRERPARATTGTLSCPSCGDESPALCSACGSGRLRVLRPGVSLAREPLLAPVVIGTEAVLHAVRSAVMVGFLDLDHELLSPRFRAAEQALVLLARAARLVGGRGAGGRLVVRTSMPDHDVVRAVQAGDPSVVASAEEVRRRLLRLPPVTALAEVTGADAAGVASRLHGVEVSPRGRGGYLVRADSPTVLAGAFQRLVADEAAGWAGIDARVEVDPLGV